MDEMIAMILKLLLSALLGGMIGLEREMHARAAGLRTHILVATGSTLIMMVSQYIYTTNWFMSIKTGLIPRSYGKYMRNMVSIILPSLLLLPMVS